MKRLWAFLFPLVFSFLIFSPATRADDPVDRDHNIIYWEFVTATNLSAATRYYPSTIGFSFDGHTDLSVFFAINSGVTMTLEVSHALSLRTSLAAAVGDMELYFRDSRSFADLEAGQQLRIGTTQLRTIGSVRADLKRVILTVALTSLVPAGTTVLVDPQWIDATESGYDVVNHAYDNATYVDVTGEIDFDNLNVMRVRICSVTSDATNAVNYKVRYK